MGRVVARLLRDHAVALAGRRVLAMVSGGCDSVVLLDVLARLPRGSRPAGVEVLFLDHGMRPIDDDRAAARAAADRAGAAWVERRADALGDRGDFEARARDWRYEQAADVARATGCEFVATGHTADDQLETLLYGMVATSGERGLRGMPVLRTLAPGVDLVRPLLSCARADVRARAHARQLAFVDDPTNDDPAHRRNLVRASVVPALLQAHPGAGANLARTQRALAQRDDLAAALTAGLLDRLVDGRGRLDRPGLQALAPVARHHVVADWLRRHGVGRAVTSRLVHSVADLALDEGGAAARVDVAGGACVVCDQYHLSLTDRSNHQRGTS